MGAEAEVQGWVQVNQRRFLQGMVAAANVAALLDHLKSSKIEKMVSN